MQYEVTIRVLPGEESDEALIKGKILRELEGKAKLRPSDVTALTLSKKSVDARRGRLSMVLRYTVYAGEQPGSRPVPEWKQADPGRRVIIVGSGPAGLFAALRLLEEGITPIIVERGAEAPERKRDIADITRKGQINPDSNYCFGEGGAGTFSDGKLYTRSNKRGDIGRILTILVAHGAEKGILTDAHPHVGSDRLPLIVAAVRNTILSRGGEFRFHTRMTGLAVEGGRVCGIFAEPVPAKAEASDSFLRADAVILAAGHSADDVYEYLAAGKAADPEGREVSFAPPLEAKTFAVGVRVEHPRELIDRIQYHGRGEAASMGAAEYRLVTQEGDRGVYSFCMCPGGLIVPSASAEEGLVVNGMSSSGRNGRWSNAAVVVETRPEDVPGEFRLESGDQLAGLRFRRALEAEAKRQGDGQKAPAQRMVDFLARRDSASLPPCSYSPGVVPSRLDLWLPARVADRLAAAFRAFDRNMRGFIDGEAILVAVETRTSSPVRIVRDPESLECATLPGLYPAGEGSGYAGGIVSSAMDGEKCAAAAARGI